MKKLLFIVLALAGLNLQASELKPFETDYCTMFIEGSWAHCCLDHDLRYWIGGVHEEQDKSDLQLKSCVQEAAGPVWANVIYRAVRLGHYSPIKNKRKWSWGWADPKRNNFQPLTAEEKMRAADEIRRSDVDPLVVERFIRENGLDL